MCQERLDRLRTRTARFRGRGARRARTQVMRGEPVDSGRSRQDHPPAAAESRGVSRHRSSLVVSLCVVLLSALSGPAAPPAQTRIAPGYSDPFLSATGTGPSTGGTPTGYGSSVRSAPASDRHAVATPPIQQPARLQPSVSGLSARFTGYSPGPAVFSRERPAPSGGRAVNDERAPTLPLPAPSPSDSDPSGGHAPNARSGGSAPPFRQDGEHPAEPWWQRSLVTPFLGYQQTPSLSLSDALQRALGQAPEIAVLGADVAQRRAALSGEQAAFDWSVFVDSSFDRDNVPVGSTLDGATNRLRQRIWNLQSGLRRRNETGGEFSIYQDFGYRRSNSQFFVPPTQGTSRITAEYTQPLLRMAGEEYNTGQIAIAGSRVEESEARLAAGTEDYLLQVAQAYWNLVLARGDVVLAHQAWARTSEIVDYMQRRRDVDVTGSQFLQARAARASRETVWLDATYEVSRAQELLLRLIYGDAYQHQSEVEIVTTSVPTGTSAATDGRPCDLEQHPRVRAAQQAILASATAARLAHADLQPRLDLVLSAYSAGLRGRGKFYRAAQDVWTDSEPGFSIGLQFEYPLGNRRATADAQRADAVLQRLQHQFRTVVADVALSIRDRNIAVEKADAVLAQSRRALEIARQDLAQLQTRRSLLLDGSNVASLYLDALLRAQDRLSDAERRVLQSQVALAVAQASRQHACGRLRLRFGGAGADARFVPKDALSAR